MTAVWTLLVHYSVLCCMTAVWTLSVHYSVLCCMTAELESVLLPLRSLLSLLCVVFIMHRMLCAMVVVECVCVCVLSLIHI